MKREQRRYGILAMTMVLLLAGGLLWMEYKAEAHLLRYFLFSLTCSALLLFSLIKLDVMEFQTGSFWARVAQHLNRTVAEEAVPAADTQMDFYRDGARQKPLAKQCYRRAA